MASDDPFDLQRFVLAQRSSYETALAELRAGHKRTHWIWFVLPQLRGLGASSMAQAYGLSGLEADLRAAGFEPVERRGFFLKTLPNSMMLQHSPQLLWALNRLGDELPVEMQANLGIRARLAR